MTQFNSIKKWQKQLKVSHLKKAHVDELSHIFPPRWKFCVSYATGYTKGEIQLITRQDMQACKWKWYVLVFTSMIILDLSGFTERSRSFFVASLPFDLRGCGCEDAHATVQIFQLYAASTFFLCGVGRHKSPNIIITAWWTDAHLNPNSWPHGEEEVNEGKRVKNGNKSGSWHGGKTVQTGPSHATWDSAETTGTSCSGFQHQQPVT